MNGIIVIDKPEGWTSFDVVAKLRGLTRERRIGHSGTLDPMATGVLPVFIGKATKAVQFAENDEKRYTAGVRFGITTDTQDMTGSVLCERIPNTAGLEDVIRCFLGEQRQIPPMYSAVKINGRKLYDLARQGIEVERKPRTVVIKSIDILSRDEEGCVLDIRCSKGTYIRTLCADIGEKLGCGAVLSSLRRTEAGAFTEKDAVSMDDVIKTSEEGRVEDMLRPTDSIFKCPGFIADPDMERLCRNGRPFGADGIEDGEYRVYSAGGEFLMLGRCLDGIMRSVKNFF